MLDGGIVIIFIDIIEWVLVEEVLVWVNEIFECCVCECIEEFMYVNQWLVEVIYVVEEVNIGKIRFLVVVGYDILQFLNVVCFYVLVLVDKFSGGDDGVLVKNVESVLELVEDILGVVMDIFCLDIGVFKLEQIVFWFDEILKGLELEFCLIVVEKGLDFRVVLISVLVCMDWWLIWCFL